MRYKMVPTKGENDCDECCFALNCINPCRIPKGMHYIDLERKNKK